MTDSAGGRDSHSLDDFLDAVAARQPTPGGGAVAAAAGALACSMARMVAAYSPISDSDPAASRLVKKLQEQLQRADEAIRELLSEDGRAYMELREASKRLKNHPGSKGEHDTALALATTIPLEIAGVACEALYVMERLLPVANRHLLSDLGVAAVMAEAAVRASSYMVRVNAASMGKESAENPLGQLDLFTARASESLALIESVLGSKK